RSRVPHPSAVFSRKGGKPHHSTSPLYPTHCSRVPHPSAVFSRKGGKPHQSTSPFYPSLCSLLCAAPDSPRKRGRYSISPSRPSPARAVGRLSRHRPSCPR